MHHPGQPRFVAVGDTVELAPRDPDPDASYRWSVGSRPPESRATVGGENVEQFTPDVAGVYRLDLAAPDGTHGLTVRAFPSEKAVEGPLGESGSGGSGQSGSGGQRHSGIGSGSAGAGDGDASGGRPRVRLDGGRDADGTLTLHATATTHPDSDADPASLDVEFYVDDRDDAGLDVSGHDATVSLGDGPARVHAVAIGERYSVADAVRVHPDGTVERLYEPPTWAREATIYEVYVRGFAEAEGKSRFEAIGDKLDYLQDLGVDTLWLTPVLQHDGYDHGYNIVDFFGIADDLGSREEYEALVETAHDRGMRVLFDLVLNHSARDHPHFQSAAEGPDAPYRDWYEWQESGEPGTYFDWEFIANFDFDSLAVRRHLLDAVDEWAALVDGFRCDMAWAVPTPFWTEIRDRVKAQDAEFLLLDETVPYIADFHEGLFDVHFDTTTYFTLREIGRGHADADAVADAVDQRAKVGFPDAAEFMLYIENHDEVRYVEECGRAETEAAAGALFTLPGVPMVYSGQEFGETVRRGFVDWMDADEDLREHYRDLVALNDDLDALAPGASFEPVDYESESKGVTAYARENGDGERVVVVLNFGPATETVALPDEAVDTTDLLSGADVDADGAKGVSVDHVVVMRADT